LSNVVDITASNLTDLEVSGDEDDTLHWKLKFYDICGGEGDSVNIKYCPFCGKFLPKKVQKN
jgi:hypothetical protein